MISGLKKRPRDTSPPCPFAARNATNRPPCGHSAPFPATSRIQMPQALAARRLASHPRRCLSRFPLADLLSFLIALRHPRGRRTLNPTPRRRRPPGCPWAVLRSCRATVGLRSRERRSRPDLTEVSGVGLRLGKAARYTVHRKACQNNERAERGFGRRGTGRRVLRVCYRRETALPVGTRAVRPPRSCTATLLGLMRRSTAIQPLFRKRRSPWRQSGVRKTSCAW